jgi:hypothetical protein
MSLELMAAAAIMANLLNIAVDEAIDKPTDVGKGTVRKFKVIDAFGNRKDELWGWWTNGSFPRPPLRRQHS